MMSHYVLLVPRDSEIVLFINIQQFLQGDIYCWKEKDARFSIN